MHSPIPAFPAAAARCFLLFLAVSLLPGMWRGLQAQETLTQALDDPALVWTAGGDVAWKAAERAGAHAGGSVAELWMQTDPGREHYGFEFADSESWLETTAAGPGLFAVWVRHNQNPYVTLTLSVDGVPEEMAEVNSWPPEDGEKFSGWYRFTAVLPSGMHKVRLLHRFAAAGTIPIDNPKVQADDAHVLPAAGADFLNAIDVPPGGQWFAGGGAEFHGQAPALSHDGVDSLISDPAPEDWGSLASPAWLRREVTGPVTLQWWQRQLSLAEGHPDRQWVQKHLFIPPGAWNVSWSGWQLVLDEFSEAATAETTLGEALDSGDRVFTRIEGTWKGALTAAAPDGVDAVWTQVSAGGKSSLETVIDGPATLHFEFSVQSLSGVEWAAADGSISCTVDGIPLHLEAGAWTGPVPAGRHVVRWNLVSRRPGGKNTGALLDQVQVTPAAAIPLGQALDALDLAWTTGGSAWTGMFSQQAPDGQHAAGPPVLASGETSWVETRVTGPGRLTFQWSGVESGYSWYDPSRGLKLSIDGVEAADQNGRQLNPMVEVGPGAHTLRWTATGFAERRPLMLDQVRWTPLDPVPLLAAVENPAVRLFASNAGLLLIDPVRNYEGGSCLRIATTGTYHVSPLTPTLRAVADRPGYLSFYYRPSSSAAVLSTPAGTWAAPFWNYTSVFLAPGALTLNWTVTGEPTQEDPAPYVLLDKVTFQPSPEIDLGQALNNPGAWRTSPEAPWTGLSGNGAWSGRGTAASPSWMERDIMGPAVLAYGWSGTGLSVVIDGQAPKPLTDFGGLRYPYLWLPAGPHVVRWESTGDHVSLSSVYVGAVRGEITMTVSGTDFLIRVPRPEGLADSLISLEANSAALDSYWSFHPAAIEASTPESVTFRLPRPDAGIPRRFYRAAFGRR
ncbi:MAG: hypothetical protein V4726_21440 [Verrucomicrobiota bacterium]